MTQQEPISTIIEKFWETIPPAWHATRATIRKAAAEKFHLTVEQFQVLRRLRRGVDSGSALAEANRTSRSSVSKAVDALVNKGLVSRSTDASDRRHVHLSLSGEGERVLSAIYAGTEAWLAARFARLTSEELVETLRSLDLLRKAFAED